MSLSLSLCVWVYMNTCVRICVRVCTSTSICQYVSVGAFIYFSIYLHSYLSNSMYVCRAIHISQATNYTNTITVVDYRTIQTPWQNTYPPLCLSLTHKHTHTHTHDSLVINSIFTLHPISHISIIQTYQGLVRHYTCLSKKERKNSDRVGKVGPMVWCQPNTNCWHYSILPYL